MLAAESAVDGACLVINGDQSVDNRIVRNALVAHESAVIRDPVIIDRDCMIERSAIVGPDVCLGENTTVGTNAVVERSVVDSDTRNGVYATVVESADGTSVTIGPSSAIPGSPGDARVKDRALENEDHGVLLADRVHDRGGVTYVPDTLIGPNADVRTGATVRGTVDDGTEVRS